MLKSNTTGKIVTNSPNRNKGYLVGWLTTLAQEYPKIIKTDDVYTKYSEDEAVGLNFYLIKTSIVDKHNTRTIRNNPQDKDKQQVIEEQQSDLVSFYVRIHKMAYTDTFYNRFTIKTKNLFKSIREKRPWRKVQRLKTKESKARLTLKDYQVIRYRALKKRWFQKLLPEFKYIDNTILLRVKLLETIPCGICQFEISPIRLKDNDYIHIDSNLWKFIFDEIHQFFHDHHFPPAKSLPANKPLFDNVQYDIISADNKSIRHYIDSIGTDLTNQLDELYRSYQELLVSSKKVKREKGQKKINDKKLLESARDFFENCDTLLGIHAFLCSVIHSPQNTRIVLNREIGAKEEMADRELAMRIESSYRGTIALMQRISHHHDFRNNFKSIQKANKGIRWSIFLGSASLALSLALAYESWKNELVKIPEWIDGIFIGLKDWVMSLF